MTRRILTLLLAAATLAGMLCACASPEPDAEEKTTYTEEETGDEYERALAKLSVNMKGDDFVVLGRNDAGNSVTEILREESSTDPLEDAVYRRNLDGCR